MLYAAAMRFAPIETAAKIVGSYARLARALGVSPAMIYQWANRVRPVPADRCPAIERATNGAVRCEDMRPDVDWAYLRGTEKLDPTQSRQEVA